MKRLWVHLALCAAGFTSVWAASVETRFVPDKEEEPTPLNYFLLESSYVLESELSEDALDLGNQDVFTFRTEYVRLFRLSGRWHLRTGIAYDRFDFGESGGPVPDHLHSLGAVIGIDYMMGGDRGALLEFRPGYYGQDGFRSESFDVPITLARAWVLQRDKLFLFTGLNVSFLRGLFPVLPLAGLIWCPGDQWVFYAVPPEPRLIYMPNKKLHCWIGGEIVGGSFRTNRNDDIVPQKLSNAAVDYSEYRAGLGLIWRPMDGVKIDFGGGYVFQRRFDFKRADEEFTTDPAPYVRVSLKAEF